MLAVTEQAASAIDGILAARELSDEAGVRIMTEIGAADEGGPRTELRLAVVEGPEEDDQVIEDAGVFVEAKAAAMLDDKVLDADVAGDQVQFDVKEQT
jgi:iron-sulfur cluster assembly protein